MRWAVPVIVVALSACILAGSLGFQDTIKETTEYDAVLSDLAPIARADPVTESVNYNPLTNVTGWSPNVSYEFQTNASLYKLVTDYEYTDGTSVSIGSMGVYIEEPEGRVGSIGWEWSNGADVGTNRPSNAIGGWSGTEVFPDSRPNYLSLRAASDVHITLNGSYRFSYFKAITSGDLPNRSIINVGSYSGGSSALAVATAWNIDTTYTYSYYRSGNYGAYVTNYELNWDAGNVEANGNGDFILIDGLWYRLGGYDTGGGPIIDQSRTYTIVFASNDTAATFGYRVVSNSTTYYIKPYTPAKLTNNTVSTWQNGYANTTVKILADAGNLSFSVNDEDLPEVGFIDLQNPAYVTWSNDYTGKVLFTLNADGTGYWQGVTSYTSTKDYTVADYQYELLDVPIDGPIVKINFSYVSSTPGEVAIVDTWIPQDSNGLLWGNAAFDIDTLFPTIWDSENIRIKFNSFVTTGSGLTINGTTYAVSDGNITIDEDTFKLAGSSIEWTPAGTTALVAPNGDRYDLGERTGGFTLNGTWYGVLSMDTFETVQAPAKEAVFGVIPEINWLAWVFVGVLAIGTVGVLATGRQLDMMDMLALGIMGLAGVVVAVI